MPSKMSQLKTFGEFWQRMWVFVVIGFSLGDPFLSTAGTPKTIIFRDDDAQAYFSTDLLKFITDTLITNAIPQTLSVIPANSNGDTLTNDLELVEYLNVIKDCPTVELALHGYQHTRHEFEDLTLAQAETNLVAGLAVMSQVLGVTPVTFVPPYNVFNTNTLTACKNKGFTRFSAADYDEPDAWGEAPAGLLHVPTTVDFQDWDNDGQFKSSAAIIQEAQNSLDVNDVAVFQLHFWALGDTNEPQQLVPENYQILLDVINWARQKQTNGVALMTIGQYTRSAAMTLPVANFTAAPLNGFAPLSVTFTDTSTAGIGTITNRQWSLGNSDITNITTTHLIRTGISAGTYSVTLIVRDNTGASSTNTKAALIQVATVPKPVFVGDNRSFSVTLGPEGQSTATFTIMATNGVKYQILHNDDLRLTNGWKAVIPPNWISGTNEPIILQDTNTVGVTQRFYRIEAKSKDAD